MTAQLWTYIAASLGLAVLYAALGIAGRRIWERATGRSHGRSHR